MGETFQVDQVALSSSLSFIVSVGFLQLGLIAESQRSGE